MFFFKIWQTQIDPSETLRVLSQIWSAPTHLRKSDLATPICAARRPRCLFTCKRGRGLWHSAQIWHRREQDDHVHYDQEDLDRSGLIDIDLSDFETERNRCTAFSLCWSDEIDNAG